MAETSKNIQYLNKDFDSLKQKLIEFAEIYYPSTFNDFSNELEKISILLQKLASNCKNQHPIEKFSIKLEKLAPNWKNKYPLGKFSIQLKKLASNWENQHPIGKFSIQLEKLAST